ncbi:MAG TPA: phosphoglycerate mutase family protein [Acidimicrobiales bacterium]|jgi:8-oxo-dGTP diphosphatase|nr:phosphoglycerate mutase family protein [Acidimicrobiales bacterium]
MRAAQTSGDHAYCVRTVSLYLVRHARAGDRSSWTGPDVDRPLSSRGQEQATSLADAFARAPLRRVLSSPSVRCQQTVGPVARCHRLDIEVTDLLAERARVGPVRRLLDELTSAAGDAVLCGHGDLIPALVDRFRREDVPVHGAGCAKASIWELLTKQGRIVSARYHREAASMPAVWHA